MTSSSQNATIADCVRANPHADETFNVQTRGRPERQPEDAARRILRRKHFGKRLRELREGLEMTLSRAANLAGLTSPRKLSQYETTCYPPGDVVEKLAPHYGVSAQDLARLVLSHSDPALYEALTGESGYEPDNAAIQAFIAKNAKNKTPTGLKGNPHDRK